MIALFKRLSWHYATNLPVKFGKRIIKTYLLSNYASKRTDKWVHVNHTSTDELDDLVRVFSVVDGKPEPDHRRAAFTALNQAVQARQQNVEMEYFSIKWFWNGNGHITFKRPDLVDRLNSIIAKHYPGALPEPRP